MSTRPTAFPADLPRSLTDRTSIIEHDWHAFSALDRLVDHWDRPGWQDDTPIMYWLVELGECHELLRLAVTCQRVLGALDGVDLVSPAALHITISRIGVEADIAPETVKLIAERASARLRNRGAFALTVGPLAGSAGAIRFSVTPWSSLIAIAGDLASATAETLGRPSTGHDRFRPHVSIAYNNRPRAARPVVDAVARLRDLSPVEVSVNAVHLVSLVRQERAYRWTTKRAIDLTR